ncbi:MAG: hypothetical protein M1822_003171 [Bathelium mastoideum]|nr:MAG: hypothetical protein M1822_003171 [Bathelium mastoideum]
MAWHDYQGLMVGKLNELTVGRPDENKTARQLLLAHARNPLEAALFNHASMAFNNNFFFESLVGQKPRSPSGTEIPQPLADSLASSFGSLATLRDELIDTADAMFGPGFVWLVQTPDMRFRLLATYLAGSPFKEAHTRLQAVDMNTQSVGSVGGLTDADVRRQTEAQNSPGSFGNFADGAANRPGGLSVTPVLCVNTWEHVWVGLYGVQGKRLYLERWWSNVDWHVVQTRCQLRSGRNDGLMTK